jgi:hypothetical protein
MVIESHWSSYLSALSQSRPHTMTVIAVEFLCQAMLRVTEPDFECS